METLDRAEEWRRLKELYRQMADEELETVAADAYDLTEVAHQALRAEIASRGLKIELQIAPEPQPKQEGDYKPDPTELDLVPIWQVWSREDADKVVAVLREHGIPAFFGPDACELSHFEGTFNSAVDVCTRNVDQTRAIAALSQALPEEATQEELSEGGIPSCPKCHSREIVFLKLNKTLLARESATFRWRCDECGNVWEDDGIENGR